MHVNAASGTFWPVAGARKRGRESPRMNKARPQAGHGSPAGFPAPGKWSFRRGTAFRLPENAFCASGPFSGSGKMVFPSADHFPLPGKPSRDGKTVFRRPENGFSTARPFSGFPFPDWGQKNRFPGAGKRSGDAKTIFRASFSQFFATFRSFRPPCPGREAQNLCPPRAGVAGRAFCMRPVPLTEPARRPSALCGGKHPHVPGARTFPSTATGHDGKFPHPTTRFGLLASCGRESLRAVQTRRPAPFLPTPYATHLGHARTDVGFRPPLGRRAARAQNL